MDGDKSLCQIFFWICVGATKKLIMPLSLLQPYNEDFHPFDQSPGDANI